MRVANAAQYKQRYSLGVVYPKGEVDFHGDTMTEDELEKAAWRALGKNVKVGLMHRGGTTGAGKVVESYIHRGPKFTMKDVSGNNQTIDTGDWLMGVIWDPTAWAAVMDRSITGFSLQGIARKSHEWQTPFKFKGARNMKSRREQPMNDRYNEDERYDERKSIFRSVIFGDAQEYDLDTTQVDDDEDMDGVSTNERMRVMRPDDEAYVDELNNSMSRALQSWSGRGDDVTRSPQDRKTPNFRRDGDGQSLPMRPGKNFEQPSTPYRMELEDRETDMDRPDTDNWLGDRQGDPTSQPGRFMSPPPSDRVGGLVRKNRGGRFGASFENIVFGSR